MTGLLGRIGIELPILQAGMGGGTAAHELAAAVSDAGGLGTIGMLDPLRLRDEISSARRLTAKPIAVNLLLPFARRAHWEVTREADVVVTFWGSPARRTDRIWIHQCGSPDEAMAAYTAGADAVIAQGIESGGHVRGVVPALELLERVGATLPQSFPILVAGGIADAKDVQRVLDAGAVAAVAGTRFLLSHESRAHPAYRHRLIDADTTIITELFGAGWPDAPHRVVRNAATDRWLGGDTRGPAPVRLLNRFSAPALSRVPASAISRLATLQRPAIPIYAPASPLQGDPASIVDAAPLYAGECVEAIRDVRPAAELTRDLAG